MREGAGSDKQDGGPFESLLGSKLAPYWIFFIFIHVYNRLLREIYQHNLH